jgi:hypothetical protein
MSNELVPIAQQKPAYLQNYESGSSGMETMQQYLRPARIKIMQDMRQGDLKKDFGSGDIAIMSPDGVQLLAAAIRNEKGIVIGGEPIYFTVLFHYTEYCTWNPLELQTGGAIRERSFDPKSHIAIKSRNPATRKEPCPDMVGKDIKHIEHCNFIIEILNMPSVDLPLLLSFQSGTMFHATSLVTLLHRRHAEHICACNFEMSVIVDANKAGNEWYALRPNNPADDSGIDPFCLDEQEFKRRLAVAQQYKQAFLDRAIVTDYEADTPVYDAPADAKGKF